jgi:Mg2+-importing ATPase
METANALEITRPGVKQSRPVSGKIVFSPLLTAAARSESGAVLADLNSSAKGLSQTEADLRLGKCGPNEVAREKEHGWPRRLLRTICNPLVILLVVLATVSAATGDVRSATVMSLMVVLGVLLRLVQETRANTAAAKLKAMITVTATVVRDGKPSERPLRDIVAGDIVTLTAGDLIPADLRLLTCKDLFLNQSSLTGESLPAEKSDLPQPADSRSPLDLPNLCFLGTSVETGSATAVVIATGPQTYFGSMAKSIVGQQAPTSFDKGVSGFTWLMIKLMAVMVPLVFLINGFTKHNWTEAFFFALAVAVGLTPEMLPMIVSVCLAKGALAMSRKKVIVKRLSSIQNFGAMDILCTDKTGTLTMDKVILEKHCDVAGDENHDVWQAAFLVSQFQTGLKNVLDRAILGYREHLDKVSTEGFEKLDEMPFDFQRRLMSVVVRNTSNGTQRIIAKGAPEEIFRRCTHFVLNGKVSPIDPAVIEDLKEQYEHMSSDGFRVLAVAYKEVDRRAAYGKADESDLVLQGYVAFLDPPKETASLAIAALHKHGVSVKVLTGDNDLVTRKVCQEVGIDTGRLLLGKDMETMSDPDLAEAAETTNVFARLSPADKQRIVKALQTKKHVVGFMGDGINDAPALRAADVGISVDSAVDIAKESADLILLEKNLMVLQEGVLEGRKVFANILKYIRMGASSNFGNMFSVLGFSAFLPYLPMLPIQVLSNNMLYDFSQVPIPADNVDEEQIAKPRPWNIDEIRKFILFIGPVSSIFDYTTCVVMLYVFHCWGNARLFETGWFVESLMTQTLIIHVIRTNKVPFIQSWASWPLIATSVLIMAFGAWLPFSPLASALGLVRVPGLYWPLLCLTLLCYVVLTQGVKTWLLRRRWI